MKNKKIEEIKISKHCKGCIMEKEGCTPEYQKKCKKQFDDTRIETKRLRAAFCAAREESGNALCAGRTPARADKSAGACVLVSSHKTQPEL